MSQNPLLNSGSQPSKTPGLKPVLAAALACLEVQLDQELARYRRTKTTYRTPSQSPVGSSSSTQLQQFTAITAATPTASYKLSPTPPISVPKTHKLEPSPLAIPQTIAEDPQIAPTPPDDKPNPGSIVPTVVKNHQSENVNPEPDDYLESSEALLRSLTEEQPPTQKRTSTTDSLLSPLGIGSMLLLLLASLTLGYVVFNPKSLSHFSFSGLFSGDTSKNADNTDSSVSKTKTVAQPQLTPIPKYPNLATDEFPEVNNPNDVVNLKPKAKPTPTALPKPVQPSSLVNSSPLSSTPPNRASTPSSPLSLGEIKPSSDGFYHIVIDNQDDSSFPKARQAVPDAYLSPDGKLIYLSALKTKTEVQKQMQELQQRGIKARVEQP
ncbi:MAG: hypothetical protein KME60_01830 [Cyanomargarita calcarea GSE-NOS-MK-12-04C]|jgi:hypothetical protein|uniref:SPOR domain-containing protein n=1 Tax=Cyanomargarita calcarea GSE-NOS-MK-12-04C TaxID=2839659 RepID=A0A951UQP5_9CYAN|nr:hypothetical protein [Cyanomargarita calcarea GSE-NOS-MK-12-04C]